MKFVFAVSLAAFALAACQQSSTVRESMAGGDYRRLDGASLVLNQEISVSAGKARVFIQNGAVGQGFDSYQPHCAFEIASVNHDGFAIAADTFVIAKVEGSIQQVVSIEPARVAALGLFAGLNGGGSASYYQGYHFWLSSMEQPEVRRMSCFGVYAQPYELYAPTMEEIGQALGPLAEIRQ